MQTLKKMKTDHGEVITSREADRDADIQRKNVEQQTRTLTTATQILDLNDDCLYEIFALQRVSASDLCSIAQTCTKLKQIANDIFARSQKSCNFNSLAVAESVMATRVIKSFGASIVALRMDFSPYTLGGERIIESILENCSALKSFTIESYEIPDNEKQISTMALLFEKLEVLSMIDVRVKGFDEFIFVNCRSSRIITPNGNLMKFFENCSSLVDLSINDCDDLERCCFETYFPKLEHFEYRFEGGYVESSIVGILFRHPNLKSFSFEADEYEDIPDMLKIIGTNCKELQKLHIEKVFDLPYDAALMNLKKLKYLTELKINWCGQSMIALVSQLQSKSLNVLEIVNFQKDPESIPAISKIKTLRVIKLRQSRGSGYLQNLNELGNLTDLIELVIEDGFTYFKFDRHYYFNVDLIGIIKRLVNLKKFKFHLNDFKTRATFHITKYLFIQMVNEVEGRPVASNRYMEIDCPTTDDITYLSCPTLKFKELE